MKHSLARFTVAAAAAALALTGCATAAGPTTPDAGSAAAAPGSEHGVTVTDPWVKAAEAGGMTAAFGMLENHGSADVTIVAASTSVSPMAELHETTSDGGGGMVMREVAGGFTVPAGGTLMLEPGGDHIMIMNLGETLEAGVEVEVVLELADGSTMSFTAPAKDYAGAREEYAPGHGGDH